MSKEIITAKTLFKNFKIEEDLSTEVFEEKNFGNIQLSRFYLKGRKTKEGNVGIYCVFVSNAQLSICSSVLIPSTDPETDEKLAIDLAKNGYCALIVDFKGKEEGKDLFTAYPDDIAYANYDRAKNSPLEIETDVTNTCYYEWDCVLKYAVGFLKSKKYITNIGIIGVNEGATSVYHVLANNNDISCAVIIGNAGWKCYGGLRKEELTTVQFSDGMLKYIAGVEPQSYANYINCPVLMLSPTNSKEYDCDRAYDTLNRIKAFTSFYFSSGYVCGADNQAYKDMLVFFAQNLNWVDEKDKTIPENPETECAFINGKFTVKPIVDERGLKEICLFVAEETADPKLRAWRMVDKTENKEKVFDYFPYQESERVYFYITAKYENGYAVSSNIVEKKFVAEQVERHIKTKILYNGRKPYSESSFVSFKGMDKSYISFDPKEAVTVKAGPMDIGGILAKGGIYTFKINSKKDKPSNDGILMFDLYIKEESDFVISLIADFNTPNQVVYSSKQKVLSGRVWHNIKLDLSKFKSEEGRVLKELDRVNVLAFSCETYCLINNIIWL